MSLVKDSGIVNQLITSPIKDEDHKNRALDRVAFALPCDFFTEQTGSDVAEVDAAAAGAPRHWPPAMGNAF